jgi:ethanolamine ammonia-lyase large subunit
MDGAELRRLLVLANAFKEGDLPVGGTRDDQVRDGARRAVRALRLGDIRRTTLVDDGVSDALSRSLTPEGLADVDRLTVGELQGTLAGPEGVAWVRRCRDGLASEAIAAVVKVMTDDELVAVAARIFNPLPGDGVVVGAPAHFGSRIQPNSPGDDDREILFSILDGLSYGCGDVIIGLNPASDDLDTIVRLEDLLHRVVDRLCLPTRFCVLSDLVKQHRARARTRVDVGFQSLAGTSRALAGMVGLDVDGLLDLARDFSGLYFETGQGSAVTNGAAENVDMVTLESRAYGVARWIRQQTGTWMIVNDVAGFIGPEVFTSAEQLERACLEDIVMAKLHGITMGLDVCATFHMGIAPAALRELTARIVDRARPAYLMAVAGNADPMLGYLTTSFREHPRLRARGGRRMTTAMQRRLAELGVMNAHGDVDRDSQSAARLYAAFAKAGGDSRMTVALVEEAERTFAELRERGFDLGGSHGTADADPPDVVARVDRLYANARHALYSALDTGVINDVSPRHARIRTNAADRDDYLMHPHKGERVSTGDAPGVSRLYPTRRPEVQIVISDGLNANALNEQLREVLPPLRAALTQAGAHVGETDVVVQNGRVRAGYHVGALVDPAAVVHLIGERPGTGLNTLSAYLTYGRDAGGESIWSPSLDHSRTTAVCGIHRRGKPPAAAVSEITAAVRRMLDERQSGVARHQS